MGASPSLLSPRTSVTSHLRILSLPPQTFETEDHDIGFSYSFLENGSTTAVGEPSKRVDSHLLPQQGKFETRKPGTLTLLWDNSFSKLRSKKLQYSVVRKSHPRA